MLFQTEVAPLHSAIEHVVFYSIQAGILGSLAKIIWGASKLTTTVDLLRTNHLPHIDEKIDAVSADVKDVRSQLFLHIQAGKE